MPDIVRSVCCFRSVKTSHPALLLRCSGWIDVVRALCRPPHEVKDFSVRSFVWFFVAIIEVRLPGLRHLLAEKTRPKRKGPDFQRRTDCPVRFGCTRYV